MKASQSLELFVVVYMISRVYRRTQVMHEVLKETHDTTMEHTVHCYNYPDCAYTDREKEELEECSRRVVLHYHDTTMATLCVWKGQERETFRAVHQSENERY